MLIRILSILAATAPYAFADVLFLTPAADTPVPVGVVGVTWKDSGNAPALTDLAGYQLFLMAGGNDDSKSIQIPITPASVSGSLKAGSAASFTIQKTAGPPGTNAYYLKMISAATVGGQVINFSSRFTMQGMTGTWSSTAAEADFKTISGTSGPATQNQVTNNPKAGAGDVAAGGSYTVAYGLQDGLTKYAPMQMVPGSKITAKNTAPLFPTSAVQFAQRILPTPSQVTTLTLSATFSVSSIENTAAAASQPTGDMAKFLARWRD